MYKQSAITFALIFIAGIFSYHYAADSSNQLQQNPHPAANEKESLEVQKLKLELQKIQQETRSINIQPWLQTGTLLAALLAATISFWSAWKTQRSQAATLTAQNSQQQQARISDLLKELGSEHLAVKIAAVQALSEYKSTAPFLVNILRVDQEPRILSATLTALRAMPDVSLPLLVDASRALRDQQLQCASELSSLGETEEDVAKALSLDNSVLEEWMQDLRFKRVNESMKLRLANLREAGKGTEAEIGARERQRVFNDWISLHYSFQTLLNVMERVIEGASNSAVPCDLSKAYLSGIILDGMNLSGWSFKGVDLRNASFREAICRGTDFSGAIVSAACFRSARLHDAVFDGAVLDRTEFGKAALDRASFINSTGGAARFRGSKLEDANFHRAKIIEGEFQGAFATRVSFKDSILFRSSFSAGKFFEADFSGADLSGVRFDNIRARGARFIDTRFAGTKLNQGQFAEAIFKGATFTAIKEFDGMSIRNSLWENVSFGEKTEGFQQYIESKKQPTTRTGNSQDAA